MPVVRRTSSYKLTDLVTPEAMGKSFAALARKARDDLVRSNQAPPFFETWVDGNKGAPEESVRPGGAIIYKFNQLAPAVIFALTYLVGISPRLTTRYAQSWFLAVNGQIWTGDIFDIPADAEVFITNSAPYHRKIDTGGIQTIGKGIVERGRRQLQSRFPTLSVERQFLFIPGGYVLKGHGRRLHAIINGRRFYKTRSDVRAGDQMTYPAIVLRQRH